MMKKFLAVPIIAILAAAGAASAAGFVGGVSAGPVQSGDATDLTCADSAEVIEWGTNDHTNPPTVSSARIRLQGATCGGEALHVIALKPDGTEMGGTRATPGRIDGSQPTGTQYARVTFPNPINVLDLNAVRITIDPGWDGLTNVLPTT